MCIISICIQIYIHTYIRTYIHTLYIRKDVYTYIYIYIQVSIHAYIHASEYVARLPGLDAPLSVRLTEAREAPQPNRYEPYPTPNPGPGGASGGCGGGIAGPVNPIQREMRYASPASILAWTKRLPPAA